MALAMTLNMISVGINTLLLTVLLALYARIYRDVSTRFTLGLLLFAGVLLIQNAVQLYFYVTMMSYFVGTVQNLVLVQNALATLALVFLVYVTWQPDAAPRAAATGPIWERIGKRPQ